MSPVDSWRRGGIDGEMVEDEVDNGDQNRSPETSLRAVALVMDGRNRKTLPAVVADFGGVSRAAWGLPR
jgi:hypothetical protein